MPEHYNIDQVKEILREYNDIPGLILEQSAIIENIRRHGAAAEDVRDDEIGRCQQRIDELRRRRDIVHNALETLDLIDKRILQLAYIGPMNPKERIHRYRFPGGWKAIALTVGYSESQARRRVTDALKHISSFFIKEL